MTADIPETMQAAAIERFGEAEEIKLMTIPVPSINHDEVLIRMEAAGVGAWDPFERRGGFAKKLGIFPSFPHVLGSDGAGTIVAVGDAVSGFKVGDLVYAFTQMRPKGGFYAQYAAARETDVSLIPAGLSFVQAAAMAVDAMTALRGLDDTLEIRPGENLMIFGASGGIGHLAIQLAKRMGAKVLAVASGDDGVNLSAALGADMAVCGRTQDVLAAARQFAPDGLDAALMTAGGNTANQSLEAVRAGGRIAYPSGCKAPVPPSNLTAKVFSGYADRDALDRLNSLIEMEPFSVVVAKTFPLSKASDAHLMLGEHFLGKLALVRD